MKSLLIAILLSATTGPVVPPAPQTQDTTSTVKVDSSSKSAKEAVEDSDKDLKLGIGARREELKARMQVLAEAYSKQLKQKVTVEGVLFATVKVDATHDAAIGLFSYGKTKEAFLLIFKGDLDSGNWDGIPESFQLTTK
jgi:hypothetical protein